MSLTTPITKIPSTLRKNPSETSRTTSEKQQSSMIWQSGKRHPIFGTPLLQPSFYAWGDMINSYIYITFAMMALTGTAQMVFTTIGIIHLMLNFLTDFEAYIPVNVPKIPVIYMIIMDGLMYLPLCTLPFLIDGFGDGPLKTVFPLINLLSLPLFPCIDPIPAMKSQKQESSKTSSTPSEKQSSMIWQSGKRHPIFGTPLLQPYVYAWTDMINSALYITFVRMALTGTAQMVFTTIGIIHFMLFILTNFEAYVPVNVHKIPVIYMNIMDSLMYLAAFTLPFLIDGFGDGPLKTVFPLINLLSLPLFTCLDPTPATKNQKQE